jgi:hypothetical protein
MFGFESGLSGVVVSLMPAIVIRTRALDFQRNRYSTLSVALHASLRQHKCRFSRQTGHPVYL